MTENSGTGGSSASFKPSSLGGKGKWIAVAVAVILVVAAVAIAYDLSISSSITKKGSITEVQGAGTNYTFQVNYGSPVKSISYQFGDLTGGAASTTGFSSGVYVNLSNGNATMNHNYVAGGDYIFSSNGTYSNGASTPTYVAPVKTIAPNVNENQSASFIFTNKSYTTAVQSGITAENIYTNSGNIALEIAYYTEPSSGLYQIYNQTVMIYHGGTTKALYFNYLFNASSGAYSLNGSPVFNLSASSYYGYSVAKIVTHTGYVNTTTGSITSKNATSVTTYYDFVALPASSLVVLPAYLKGQVSGTFTNAELETGGFRTLDPQLAYDTVSDEILANTYQQLTIYNGSSVSGFSPSLAAFLPTLGKGVNAHYHNYTATFNSTTAGYGSRDVPAEALKT